MKKKPLEGKRVQCSEKAPLPYKGLFGTIEYCSKCCRAYRVEWDTIGNNVRLKSLRKFITILK